jgi:hypothetical protein
MSWPQLEHSLMSWILIETGKLSDMERDLAFTSSSSLASARLQVTYPIEILLLVKVGPAS